MFLPHSLFLSWSRLQGVSHKGYVSKPPVPKEHEANRLRDEAVKRRKDVVRDTATRKTERNLPIFDLTPEALYAGSRTSNMLLPRDVTTRRAKSAVAEFPDNPEDLWKIKMCPETGYLSVVSSSFNSLSICATPLPAP